MKKTTVEWFCDRCGKRLPDRPLRVYYVALNGDVNKRNRVFIEYKSPDVPFDPHTMDGIEFERSMLCAKCKKEILEEVIKVLKVEIKKER